MHRPGPGDEHRMPCTPPPRCRTLPGRCRTSSEVHCTGHRVRWRPPSGVHSARCRPLPSRWCASRCAWCAPLSMRWCAPVGAAVRTADAAAGWCAHHPAPGAYRGARRARSGARCRRQGEPDRAEFPYHAAPCPPSDPSPECALWGPRTCGRSHEMGSMVGSAGARRIPGRAVRTCSGRRCAGCAHRGCDARTWVHWCAHHRLPCAHRGAVAGECGAPRCAPVRRPGVHGIVGARTMPFIVIADARDEVHG